MSDAPAYAELDVTSNFSFLRGASHPDELVQRAAELGYTAIAITDHNSLAGVVRAHQAAKEAGVKLVIGARLGLVDGPEVLVWPADRAAYGRLCRLLTLGKRRAAKDGCELPLADLLEQAEGMWAGVVAPPAPDGAWAGSIRLLREGFGDRLSIAVSWSYGAGEQARVGALSNLAGAMGVPLLATGAVLYHDPSRRRLQDVLTCVRHGCTIHEAGYHLVQTPNTTSNLWLKCTASSPDTPVPYAGGWRSRGSAGSRWTSFGTNTRMRWCRGGGLRQSIWPN